MKFYKKLLVFRDEFGRVKYVKSPVMNTFYFATEGDSKIKLTSDKEPNEFNVHGIHCVNEKKIKSLKKYDGEVCELIPAPNSKAVIHEFGARLQRAIITKINGDDYFVRIYKDLDEFIKTEFGLDSETGEIDFDKVANIQSINTLSGAYNLDQICMGNIEILAKLKLTYPKVKNIEILRGALLLYLGDIGIGIINAEKELLCNTDKISYIYRWNELSFADLIKALELKYNKNPDIERFTFNKVLGKYQLICESSERVREFFTENELISRSEIENVFNAYIREISGAEVKGYVGYYGVDFKLKSYVIHDVYRVFDEQRFSDFCSYVITGKIFMWSKVETRLIKNIEVVMKSVFVEAAKSGNVKRFKKLDKEISNKFLKGG